MHSDAELVDQVVSGTNGAFDELYRRHAQAAWRLAQSITGNPHDAADAVSEAFANVLRSVRDGRLQSGGAFRSYLLTATRNAAFDGMRRSGRSEAVAEETFVALPAGAPGPNEHLTSDVDAAFVAEAFRDLPERWRSVLWLTEVEGIATKEAASILGLSPNGAAQLAVRARAGLRERYLQAHLRNEADPDCRFTVDRLGAYVGGALSPRDLAKVDQHLAACEPCQQRREELEDVGTSLRRIVLPIPLVLGAASAGKVSAALASATGSGIAAGAAATDGAARAGSAFGRRVASWNRPAPWLEKVAAVSSAAVLTAGVVSSTIVGGGGSSPLRERELVDRAAAPSAPSATDSVGSTISLGAAAFGSRIPIDAGTTGVRGSTAAGADLFDVAGDGETVTGETPSHNPAPPPPVDPPDDAVINPPDPEPVLQTSLAGKSGPFSGSLSAGAGDGACTGGDLNGSSTGCTTDAPADDGLTVSTGGEVLPEQEITLP